MKTEPGATSCWRATRGKRPPSRALPECRSGRGGRTGPSRQSLTKPEPAACTRQSPGPDMAEDRVHCASALHSLARGDGREGGGPHPHGLLHPQMPASEAGRQSRRSQASTQRGPSLAWSRTGSPGPARASPSSRAPGAASSLSLRRPHHIRARAGNLTSSHPERRTPTALARPRGPVTCDTHDNHAWSAPPDLLWAARDTIFCFCSIEEHGRGKFTPEPC